MKISKIYFISLLIVSGLVACKKDFLDVPDKRIILRQVYVKDLKTTSDFLNGVYIELAAKFYAASTITYPELVADNIKPVSVSGFLINQYNWTQTETDDKPGFFATNSLNANGLWYSGYRIIRACNFILENVDQYRSENPAKADDVKGQALSIRALVLHQLVNTFAQPYAYSTNATHLGVPCLKSSLYTEKVTRQSVAEVYNSIIEDLNQGISIMPVKPTNVKEVNRFEVVSKDAAEAILARVFLFKGDYVNARRLAIEISNKYPLMTGDDYPSKLYTTSDSESLFKLTPAPDVSDYSTFFSGAFYRSYKQYAATKDIWSALNASPTDSRRQWISIVTLEGGQQDSIITKYPTSVTSKLSEADADYYQTIIRSSEMFLTAAESFFMLGDEANAKLYLDKIKFRADPNSTETTLSGNQLLENIYQERNKELCFEGLRMFDLLRWKKGVNRLNPLTNTVRALPYPSPKAIAPLPFSDVNSGMPQNESY